MIDSLKSTSRGLSRDLILLCALNLTDVKNAMNPKLFIEIFRYAVLCVSKCMCTQNLEKHVVQRTVVLF